MLSPVVFGLFAAIHENTEGMLLVNESVTASPLQIVAVFKLVIAGGGLTVTVTVCGVPGQEAIMVVGVTVYITVCTVAALSVMVLLKGLPVCVVKLSPVVFRLSAAIHE